MDKVALHSMDARPTQDYYSVLGRVIEEVSQDHAHFRSIIYEFARVKLRKELYQHFVDGRWPEIEKQVRGLEAAIARIESDFAQSAPLLHFNSEVASIQATDGLSIKNALALGPEAQQSMLVGVGSAHVQPTIFNLSPYERHPSSLTNVSEANDPFANALLGKLLRSRFWRSFLLIVAVALGIAIYAAVVERSGFGLFGLHGADKPTTSRARNEVRKEDNVTLGRLEPKPTAAIRRAVPDVPLPTEYGVYAIANGRLTELDLLPIRAPDPRVAVSASISTPSRIRSVLG